MTDTDKKGETKNDCWKNGEWRNYKKYEKWVNCKNLMNVLFSEHEDLTSIMNMKITKLRLNAQKCFFPING